MVVLCELDRGGLQPMEKTSPAGARAAPVCCHSSPPTAAATDAATGAGAGASTGSGSAPGTVKPEAERGNGSACAKNAVRVSQEKPRARSR